MRVEWTTFRDMVNSRSLQILCIEDENSYDLYASENNLELECYLYKNPIDTTDVDDFVGNYLPNVNPVVGDEDGERYFRIKSSKRGFTYLFKGFDFYTSKLNSLEDVTRNGTPSGYITIKYYDSSMNQLTTQADIDSLCVCSCAYFEPTFDYELISGIISCETQVNVDATVHATMAPRVPALSGGTLPFVCGLNLQGLSARFPYKFDGRSAKMMQYDATYHTNELEIMVRHPAGFQTELVVGIEVFR